MNSKGTILLADDEETFRLATAELLEQDGYRCDAVADASAAMGLLQQRSYDVLISDIRMPGNEDLAFIKQLPDLAGGMQAILVTGHPSVETAVISHTLPVVTYLLKPIEFDELRSWTAVAVRRARAGRIVRASRGRIEQWREDLVHLENAMRADPASGSPVGLEEYLNLTMANLLQSLMELKKVTDRVLLDQEEDPAAFHPPEEFVRALRETVNVLQKTKGSFKSRELGQLRQRIERVLEDGDALGRSGE